MFENKIIFESFDPIFSDKSIRPEPAVINIHEWYKKLNKYRRSSLFAIKTLDGTENVVASMVKEAEDLEL